MERELSESTLERQADAEQSTPETPTPTESAWPQDPAELQASLRRIERVLEEIHDRFETITRERRHHEFSPARLIGAILQALVLGFVIAALANWAYGAKEGPLLVKLAFAAVFQLGALTAFMLSREKS